MKKTYIFPEVTVVELEMKQHMLAGSITDNGDTIEVTSGGDYGDGSGITILSRGGRGFGDDE